MEALLIAKLDRYLEDVSQQRVVPATEVIDMLLDLRSMLTFPGEVDDLTTEMADSA